MQPFIFLLATTLAYSLSRKTTQIKRNFIGKTGASFLFFNTGISNQNFVSVNGDRTYFYQSTQGSVTYGIIFIEFKGSIALPEAEMMLARFMLNLQRSFNILYNTGSVYEFNNASVRLKDYWQDKNKKDWKVKGITNGNAIAVLYVSDINEGEAVLTDRFLNGFKFNY